MTKKKAIRRITIRDLARRLHLSHATVSRELNDHPRISDITKKRVIAEAAELNYRPNIIARGLANKQTSLIGLVIRDIHSSFHAEIIAGVQEIVEKEGLSIILCNSDKDEQDEARHLQTMIDKQVEGIVLVPVSGKRANSDLITQITQDGIPLVLVATPKPGLHVPCVKVDNELGGYLATKHLISLGHQHIGYLTFSKLGFNTMAPGSDENVDRYRGYLRALKEAGLGNKAQVLIGGLSQRDINKFMHSFIPQPNRATALFAFSDEMAIEVIHSALDMEYDIPGDLSIIGFDDLPYAALVYPGLSTVAQPKLELGAISARKLLNLMHGRRDGTTILEPILIVRESTDIPNKKIIYAP
jgi:LacI family transcriptional regulator